MRTTTGLATDGEIVNPQVISKFHNIVGPIDKRTVGFRVRHSVTRPIGQNHMNTERLHDRVIFRQAQPGAWRAMKEEKSLAARAT